MKENTIQTRPNLSNGLWLGFLLPTAIAISTVKYNNESSELYKSCFVFALGILYATNIFIIQYLKTRDFHVAKKHFIFPAFIIGTIFYIFFNKGIIICLYSGVLSSYGFYKLYIFILRVFPLCFTLGEALISTQGIVIFLYSTTINVYEAANLPPITLLQIATLIIQVGLSALAVICFVAYKYKYFRTPTGFYSITVIIIAFLLLLPLHLLLRQSPLLWIFRLITKDINTIIIFIYWIICSGCAMYAVGRQISGARKASTVIRKSFHVLAVLVFFPGLLRECAVLYLASGIALGLFIALELLRNLNIPPIGTILQDGFIVFSDDKDTGGVALTPIYLLVGCSLPLWLHPAPCDMTDSAGFNLFPLASGLLSVGIGDTVASYVGSWFGKHKWTGSNKTIEGTLGCILSQMLAVYLAVSSGQCDFQQQDLVKMLISIVVVSVVEAKTTQVDNLALPLLMYCILLC